MPEDVPLDPRGHGGAGLTTCIAEDPFAIQAERNDVLVPELTIRVTTVDALADVDSYGKRLKNRGTHGGRGRDRLRLPKCVAAA
jgi:hypothetical protein